jgi:hypothetical protein
MVKRGQFHLFTIEENDDQMVQDLITNSQIKKGVDIWSNSKI